MQPNTFMHVSKFTRYDSKSEKKNQGFTTATVKQSIKFFSGLKKSKPVDMHEATYPHTELHFIAYVHSYFSSMSDGHFDCSDGH